MSWHCGLRDHKLVNVEAVVISTQESLELEFCLNSLLVDLKLLLRENDLGAADLFLLNSVHLISFSQVVNCGALVWKLTMEPSHPFSYRQASP